ncbi:2Fe-2S iron-sulfur cluster binding domain-containing protein [Tamlana agarivorans]|uniref:2Fe-2S iron-sulfur cluster binding domain-containing protein n=1 Tax=Pseudotamlana agarivorans TaxID=481183 RepID=A0ACC5U945_9FLAO|nr:2Fe-2S iron-sulfur cluster-binding protein [Tamlana agarivorans]MBU2950849.1 2Fe-2S iron-sulfur cluster binding domain-containing protein [Tamlana agarivorans]
MKKITFITSDNQSIVTEANSGNIMELAVKNKVKGIDGDCGGVCSCATCHVHVEPSFWNAIGAPDELENDMLEFDDHVSEFSRLSCQLQVSEVPDGLVLKVAK